MANALPVGTGTKVFSGARAVFVFNGTQIAYAAGVEGSKEIIYQPVDRLDQLETDEHVPVGYRVSLSCSIFRTISKGPSTDDTPGSLEQQAIFPQLENILTTEGCDVFIIDRISNKTIATFYKVKTATQRFSISARGIVMQNVSFVTTKMTDESQT